MPDLTPEQHAQFGCDYLDELLNDLESHDWCWMGDLRGAYGGMAHSVSGIASEFNEHAKALGLPLVFDVELKKTSNEATDFWLKIVDPVKGGQSSTLSATLHQPKGANHSIKPYPFDPPRQREFRDFIERLKRELRRRAELELESPGTEPADVATKGMRWQQAMKVAEDHCARNPFPGVNALAKIVRQTTGRTCSKTTVRKAIDHSTKLRAKLTEHEAQRKSVSAGAMTEGAAASAMQARERDPAEAASTDEIFRALVEQAKEKDRANLNAMSDAQRRELVAAMDEDSIRELFKPQSR